MNITSISRKELDLTIEMLELASYEFRKPGSDHDVDVDVYSNWSLNERREFVKEFYN